MLLAHALFRKAYYGDTEEPGKAITSVHHKDSIAKEGDSLGSAALTRAMHRSGRAHRGGCCAELVATAFGPRAWTASRETPAQLGTPTSAAAFPASPPRSRALA